MAEVDVPPAAAAPAGIFYGYVTAVASCFSMALIFSVHYAFGVFFTPLTREFGWTRAMTSGAFSMVWLMQGVVGVVLGGVNDRFGPRRVLTICALLIGGGYLLTSQTQALWQLYVFYGCMVGAGLGGTFVPLTSTTARWFVRRRGLMTGIVTSGVGIGALAGPPLANWLIGSYNWRTSYLVLGGVVLVGVLAAAQLLRKSPAEMGLKPLGWAEVASGSRPSRAGLSLGEAGRRGAFWAVSAVFFCYGYMWTAILLHLAPYAMDMGYSAGSGARLISLVGAGSIAGKVLLGMLADRIGDKATYQISFVAMGSALLWLLLVQQFWALAVFALFFGFAYGGLATSHSPLVAWLFGLRKHGLVFGACFNGFTLGCALGPIVSGHIFDITHSYRLAFIICCGMAVSGLSFTLPLRPASMGADGFADEDFGAEIQTNIA